MINLLKIDSYCKYFEIFSNTKHFTPEEKIIFVQLIPSVFYLEIRFL